MEYLLSLLDRPYNEDFLGMYNFLWDRMRAIRMDLRMQHIFNRDAITLLEQMVCVFWSYINPIKQDDKRSSVLDGCVLTIDFLVTDKTSHHCYA